MNFRAITTFCLMATYPAWPAAAVAQSRGIVGRPAPNWSVSKWINLPPDKTRLDIGDYRGKVLYLYCFQSWCPGCHSHGFPTLQKLIRHYEGNDNVAFAAVQTVFEGFSTNTFDRAKQVAKQYKLSIPVGQSGERGRRSELMRHYRTGGTPWTIIIDRNGIVRFDGFNAEVASAARLIDRLLKEPAKSVGKSSRGAGKTAKKSLPRSRGGRDMLGKPLPLDGLGWLNTAKNRPVETEGKVTLVRWWTDACPYCARSLPAIERLRREFGDRGFATIAVYHPKPQRPVSTRFVLKAAEKFGYAGPVAVDPEWEVLRRLYLAHQERPATSVTFLLDGDGFVRFVHPGPQFGPTRDPGHKSLNRDYEDIRTAIKVLLAE